MTFQEVLPSVRCSVWNWFHPLFLENVPHRLAADFLDAHFAEFAHDSGQPEPRGFGNQDHEFPDLSGLALSALGILRRRTFTITQPAIERAGADDRDQLFDGSTDGFAELDQTFSFRFRRVNLAGDACPQDLVLLLQILDVFGEFIVGCGGNQGELWVENLGHRGIVGIVIVGGTYTFLVPRCAYDFCPQNMQKSAGFRIGELLPSWTTQVARCGARSTSAAGGKKAQKCHAVSSSKVILRNTEKRAMYYH